MSDEVLGFARVGDNEWEPIYPTKRGYVYTCAFVLCCMCDSAIRSMGGPMSNAYCFECKDKEISLFTSKIS